jgi:ribosome assembly protein YihI (activator of Der GTPase)
MKKRERKKRRKKRKIDSTEKESGTDSNNIPAASTNKQESLTSKVICIRLRLCKF